MAGRGGRGGRGGRWGGRGGGSVTQDLIRDNLEDLGMDSYQQAHEDMRTPPPLYPPIELPEPIAPDATSSTLIRKTEALSLRIKTQPYFMSRKKPSTTAKVSAETADNSADVGTITINSLPKDWVKYVPHELFDGSQLKSKSKGKGVDLNVLQNLEQAEKNGEGGEGQKKDGEEGSDIEEEEEENAEDMDVDDDYMVDHYASDGDNDDYGGDDDREAVF